MNTPLVISRELVGLTLTQFQRPGRRQSECVSLWLGKRRDGCIHVEKVWVPEQTAGADFFEIPERSMEALFAEIRKDRLVVAAQIHTHPYEAFHSYADDKWAIVRHTGALSLVVPYFGLKTSPDTLFQDTAVFVLSADNQWLEVQGAARLKYYQLTE
jgi:hypothetical protein